jgi:putative cardiolipin synthase
MLMYGCATFPPESGTPKQVSHAYPYPEETLLGKSFSSFSKHHPGDSGFFLINKGTDGLKARLELVRKAQQSLDLQYYIFRGDDSGLHLAHALLQAADRGVRIRILVDDGDTEARDDQLRLMTAHPNIQMRVFNPFDYRGHSSIIRALDFALNTGRLDYRMHNKLFIADNAVALIGGRNIGDAYFQMSRVYQLGDDDLFTVGPLVKQLSGTFDEFWNSPLSVPVGRLSSDIPDAKSLALFRKKLEKHYNRFRKRGGESEPLEALIAGRTRLIWASARLLYDSPEKKLVESGKMPGHLMRQVVERRFSNVRSELLVVSPFFVPGREGMVQFSALRARNVDVRILTNSLNSTNVLIAQSGYMHYRKALIEEGVHLYEIKAALGNPIGSGENGRMLRYGAFGLHGKMWVLDRESVYIGSMNLDERSEKLNTEIGLIIDSRQLAKQVAKRFEELTRPDNAYRVLLSSRSGKPHLVWQTREEGKIIDYRTEPTSSQWRKLKVDLMTHLNIDGEL